MTLGVAEPGALRQHLAGGASDDIRSSIPGMRNGIPYPLEEGLGFRRVVCKTAGDGLRLLDDGRRRPVNNGGTLQIIGQMRRLEFHRTPDKRLKFVCETCLP